MILTYTYILKIKQLLISCFIIILICTPFLCFAEDKPTFLAPIRRVGIEIVETNAETFKDSMALKERNISGALAQYFTPIQFRLALTDSLEKVTRFTGRFWVVSKSNPYADSNQDALSQESNLSFEKEFALDAWLKVSVQFSAEQTLVRTMLVSTNGAILTQESIAGAPFLRLEDIENSFEQAMERMIRTLGHDGRVVSLDSSLAVLDFGEERGLAKESMISAGVLYLTHFHPQTKEYLQVKRQALFECKIIETRLGSSLCEITRSDNLEWQRLKKYYAHEQIVFLAWRGVKKDSQENKTAWVKPDKTTGIVVQAAPSGYAINPNVSEEPQVPSKPVIVAENETTFEDDIKPSSTRSKNFTVENETSENKNIEQTSETKKPSQSELTLMLQPKINVPQSWILEKVIFGVYSRKSFYLSDGDLVTNGLPRMLLNTFQANAQFQVAPQIYFEPELNIFSYRINGMKGNIIQGRAAFYATIWESKMRYEAISAGGVAEAFFGKWKLDNGTTYRSDSINFSGEVQFQEKISQVLTYNIKFGVSFAYLVSANFNGYLLGQIREINGLPKELGFDLLAKKTTDKLNEYMMGVNWNFLPILRESVHGIE